jgi:hypothetical protein
MAEKYVPDYANYVELAMYEKLKAENAELRRQLARALEPVSVRLEGSNEESTDRRKHTVVGYAGRNSCV